MTIDQLCDECRCVAEVQVADGQLVLRTWRPDHRATETNESTDISQGDKYHAARRAAHLELLAQRAANYWRTLDRSQLGGDLPKDGVAAAMVPSWGDNLRQCDRDSACGLGLGHAGACNRHVRIR